MFQKIQILALTLACLTLVACGGKGSGNKTNPEGQGGIAWESIPSEFNPHEEKIEADLQGTQTIKMNLFGFNQDVRIQYSKSLDQNKFQLQLFTVSKDARTSLSGAEFREDGTNLQINKYGGYECSIETKNRQVTALKGACYIKVVLTLPAGAEVEVYNVGQLLTQRFFAMDNKTFLKELHDAWSNDKLAVIDSYLSSYQAIGKTPGLLTAELKTAIHEFSFGEQKLEVLRKLHRYTLDRENLPKMIETEFSYFDQDDARKIVGL